MTVTIRRLRILAAGLGLVLVSGLATAHQQWLAPNFVFQSGESAWLSFDHTFGDQRFQASSGPGSYYSWWIIGPDGLRRNVPHLFLGKTRTVGEIELTEPGTYRIEAVEDLMPWTLLKVDGKDTWQPGTRADFDGFDVERSRVYFNKSVSYVTLGSMSQSLLSGTGDPLEITFAEHPNDLRAGTSFEVRVLTFGEPLSDQEIRIFAEASKGHDANDKCSTNSSGVCEFEMASPGRYLLATSTEGTSADDDATDGYSHGYSVVIELKAAAAVESRGGE